MFDDVYHDLEAH